MSKDIEFLIDVSWCDKYLDPETGAAYSDGDLLIKIEDRRGGYRNKAIIEFNLNLNYFDKSVFNFIKNIKYCDFIIRGINTHSEYMFTVLKYHGDNNCEIHNKGGETTIIEFSDFCRLISEQNKYVKRYIDLLFD